MKGRPRYLIYPSYLLAIVAAILGIVIPPLLDFFASGGCIDYCGIFVRPGYSYVVMGHLLFCVALYVSRKKVRLGSSKLWIILELIALSFVATSFISNVLEFSDALGKTFTLQLFSYYLHSSSIGEFFWQIFLISVELWTIGAYLLVWLGAPVENTGTIQRKPLKGLLIMGLFSLFIGSSVFGGYFYLNSLLRDGIAKKCKADFIELQKEHASTICTIDSDCSIDELVDELDVRERERIKKSQGGKDFIGFTEAQFKFSDLEFHCNDLRLRCQAGKCVPNK